MNYFEIVNGLVVVIGIPTMVGTLITVGRKLQILDSLNITVEQKMEPKLEKLVVEFEVLKNKMNILWRSHVARSKSPRQLNDLGKKILRDSGIDRIVDQKRAELTKIIKEKNPTNSYDAEKIIVDVLMTLPQMFPEIIDQLKEGAFQTGSDIDTVLFVGSLYLRNLIFPELGFKIDGFDKI